MKRCGKCKERKDESEFNWKNKKKDFLQNNCRECQKQINLKQYEDNKEERKERQREQYRSNREKEKQKRKKWYRKNKEKRKEYWHLPLKYNSTSQMRKEIEKYEETKQSKDGNIEVKCTYCSSWFEPTKIQIQNRLKAINGERGEQRLYCCNKCKENCPTYNQSWHERGYKPATSREVQPELRKLVFQRDNYTCQKCGHHKDELKVGIHCHHIDGIRWNPLESADVYNCITLCEDCHNEAHDQTDCRYKDLQCKEEIIYE